MQGLNKVSWPMFIGLSSMVLTSITVFLGGFYFAVRLATAPIQADIKIIEIALTNHITKTNKKIDKLAKEFKDLKKKLNKFMQQTK